VPRKHHGGKSQREKVSKTFHQNRADSLAASDKGSCFKQEKLLALDEEDVRYSLSIASLAALSPFEAVTVTFQLNRYLVGFLHVVYEWAFSLCASKLRRLKNRSEKHFLSNLGVRAVEFRSCQGYFPLEATFETPLLLIRALLLR